MKSFKEFLVESNQTSTRKGIDKILADHKKNFGTMDELHSSLKNFAAKKGHTFSHQANASDVESYLGNSHHEFRIHDAKADVEHVITARKFLHDTNHRTIEHHVYNARGEKV